MWAQRAGKWGVGKETHLMSMNMTTSRLLEMPLLTPELRLSIERLLEIADEDWLASILYGRASQDRHKLMRSIDDQLLELVGWCQPIRWYPSTIVRDSDRCTARGR